MSGASAPLNSNHASAPIMIAIATSQPAITQRRSKRSASAPATGVNSSAGIAAESTANEKRSAEPVFWKIHAASAKLISAEPKSSAVSPSQSSRNAGFSRPRRRSASRLTGSACGSADRPCATGRAASPSRSSERWFAPPRGPRPRLACAIDASSRSRMAEMSARFTMSGGSKRSTAPWRPPVSTSKPFLNASSLIARASSPSCGAPSLDGSTISTPTINPRP